ncbi:MAG: dihydrofolate synthase, partial [Bacteroidia bacterium]
NDKDLSKILSLFPKEAHYYFTQAQVQRAMPAKKLQEKANRLGLQGDYYENVTLAKIAANQNAKENDVIYIGGSIFIVAEAV